MLLRVDKYCANLGWFTRRTARMLTKNKPVVCNDVPVTVNDKIKEGDLLERNTHSVVVKTNVHAILYKSAGYISSDYDEFGWPTYRHQLSTFPYHNLVHVAGRLDQDTEGLLLLTSDGQLIHNIISPKKKITKTYYLETEKTISDSDMLQLSDGVDLGDGVTTLPAQCKKLSDRSMELSIVEGKYHQVKRMLEAVDNKVIHLKRLSIGPITLDGLGKGERRELSQQEVDFFMIKAK